MHKKSPRGIPDFSSKPKTKGGDKIAPGQKKQAPPPALKVKAHPAATKSSGHRGK